MRGRWRSSDHNVPIKHLFLMKLPDTSAQRCNPIKIRPLSVRHGKCQACKLPQIRTFTGESSITQSVRADGRSIHETLIRITRSSISALCHTISLIIKKFTGLTGSIDKSDLRNSPNCSGSRTMG
ncbi:hypothetical protein N7495_007448 [Penicillium taxi]|uniref:uncharacterized protein n=1 Tax=Penicillium taxi TaxID=168475 RepID=UPI00254532CF|nr:uncharacterized protein N7495_007448 [Penicillium taxi]KAJ5887407.1 hypothetical protein N7495_007448 [Penicillium taxi]